MLYMYRDVKTKTDVMEDCESPFGIWDRLWRKIALGKGTILNCATVCACVRRVFPLGLCAREFTFSLSPLPIRPDAWLCACRFFLISFFLIVAFSSRSPVPTLKQNVGVYSFAQFKTWVPFPFSPARQIRAQGCMSCREKIDEKCSIFL